MNYLEAAKVLETYVEEHRIEFDNHTQLAFGRAIKALKKIARYEEKAGKKK